MLYIISSKISPYVAVQKILKAQLNSNYMQTNSFQCNLTPATVSTYMCGVTNSYKQNYSNTVCVKPVGTFPLLVNLVIGFLRRLTAWWKLLVVTPSPPLSNSHSPIFKVSLRLLVLCPTPLEKRWQQTQMTAPERRKRMVAFLLFFPLSSHLAQTWRRRWQPDTDCSWLRLCLIRMQLSACISTHMFLFLFGGFFVSDIWQGNMGKAGVITSGTVSNYTTG